MHKVGDVVGRFTLEQELGRGPMSEVFLAVEAGTGWKAAFKIFILEPGAKPGDNVSWAQRMVREATAAARFRHANVVQVHEVGDLGDAPYLVRDFIVGRSLAEYVGDSSQGVAEAKVYWVRELARTLADIHRAGLVHREVRPTNMLVRRDGELRVLDFGVARRSIDREAGLVARLSGPERIRVLGTPAYMAPERFANQGSSPATDQFGWGVLAYELFAGRLPWGHAGPGKRLKPATIIDAILTTTPDPVTRHAPGLSRALDAVLARTMARSPAERFPSMDYVLRDLDQALRATSR
jgi:serine/threonine-protein kinase